MYKSKYKIGDKVRVVTDDSGFTDVLKGDIMVLDFFDNEGEPHYKHLKENIGRSVLMWDEEVELLTVQDSKLARRLYKNNIDKIEDGKIFLKR